MNLTGLGLFGEGLFLPYALVAWGVIVVRIATHRFQRVEWLLLALLLGHHLLEVAQLIAGDGELRHLPDRYFGPVAPLLWLWTAYGLVWLWQWRKDGWRWLFRLLVIAFLLEVAGYEGGKKLVKEYRRGAARDALVAGEAMAPLIRADYQGPARHSMFRYVSHEYYTSRRPVVLGPYAAAAWAVRGHGDLTDFGYPLPEDYRAERVDDHFKEPSPIHYRFVGEVFGTRYPWRLYRRLPDNERHVSPSSAPSPRP